MIKADQPSIGNLLPFKAIWYQTNKSHKDFFFYGVFICRRLSWDCLLLFCFHSSRSTCCATRATLKLCWLIILTLWNTHWKSSFLSSKGGLQIFFQRWSITLFVSIISICFFFSSPGHPLAQPTFLCLLFSCSVFPRYAGWYAQRGYRLYWILLGNRLFALHLNFVYF